MARFGGQRCEPGVVLIGRAMRWMLLVAAVVLSLLAGDVRGHSESEHDEGAKIEDHRGNDVRGQAEEPFA